MRSSSEDDEKWTSSSDFCISEHIKRRLNTVDALNALPKRSLNVTTFNCVAFQLLLKLIMKTTDRNSHREDPETDVKKHFGAQSDVTKKIYEKSELFVFS